MDTKEKRDKRKTRHKRVRAVIKGTKERPRLSVFRSNAHIYAQLIDDVKGITLLATNDVSVSKKRDLVKNGQEMKKAKDKKITIAFKVGETIAKKALEKGISLVVFDRNGYKYHGRVKALAEGARNAGLKF